MSDVRERASDFVRDLGDAARKNPLSAALIGMGAIWLLTGRRGLDRLPDVAQNVWEGAVSGLGAGRDSHRDSGRRASDEVHGQSAAAGNSLTDAGGAVTSSVRDYADGFPDMANNAFENVRANASELFRTQPLALGAVGVAIGAAIAASLPSTEMEAAYLGETSDFVRQKAGEIAGEQTTRASDIGRKVVDAVADEARQQGLTMDNLKSAGAQIPEKVQRVASAAVKERNPHN